MADTFSHTLLVVDDDPAVLNLLCRILGKYYRVLAASSGQDALSMFEGNSDNIDLAISDVVMPHLSGPDLIDRLRATKPSLNALFITGYVNSAEVRERIIARGMAVLPKPFSMMDLLRTVREQLPAGHSASAAG